MKTFYLFKTTEQLDSFVRDIIKRYEGSGRSLKATLSQTSCAGINCGAWQQRPETSPTDLMHAANGGPAPERLELTAEAAQFVTMSDLV